jgi:hypothetical protein
MSELLPENEVSGSDNAIPELIKITAGVIFFLASFGLLWWNENRIDPATFYRDSIQLSAGSVDAPTNGKLIAVTGDITSPHSLSDAGFLRFGRYFALNRKVEMFAWVELESKDTESGFLYRKQWTESPPDSDLFIEQEGHSNPPFPQQSRSYAVKEATIGTFKFSPESADLPAGSPVFLNRKNYVRSLGTARRGDYIYIGKGSIEEPIVGDIRLSYSAIRSGIRATLFGKVTGQTIEPYFYGDNIRIYRLFSGSREDALQQIPPPGSTTLWFLRLAGFLTICLGLHLCFGPLNARFKFIPSLEGARQLIVTGIILVAALALTSVSLLILLLTDSLFILGAVLVVTGTAIGYATRIRSHPRLGTSPDLSEMQSTTPTPSTRQQSPLPPQAPRKKRSTLPLDDGQVRQIDQSSEEESGGSPEAGRQTASDSNKIRITCEGCGLGYTVPAAYKGRKVRCHKCRHKFFIPLGSFDERPTPTVVDTTE